LSCDPGGDRCFEPEGIDLFKRESARGRGENVGVIAIAANNRLVANGINAIGAQRIEENFRSVSFSDAGIISGHKEVTHTRLG